MTLNELRKTKDYLTNKRAELLNQRNDAYDKAYVAEKSQFDSKIFSGLIYYGLPYVGMTIGCAILAAFGITLSIPSVLALPTFLIPTAIVGTYFKKKYEKKMNFDGRLEEFSTAKTEEEKLEEQIHYEIEGNKYARKAAVIEEALNDIERKEKIMSTYGEMYTSSENKAKESEISTKISRLDEILVDKSQKLDVLSTQKLLAAKFINERIDYNQKGSLAISLGLGVIGFMYTMLPFIVFGTQFTGIAGIASIFGMYGVNAAIFAGYSNKRSKIKKRVFDKFNKDLGNDALSETSSDVGEISELESKISKNIKDASMALILLEEKKRELESIKFENTSQESKVDTRRALEVCMDDFNKLGEIKIEPIGRDRNITMSSSRTEELPIEEVDSIVSGPQGPTLVKRDKHNK